MHCNKRGRGEVERSNTRSFSSCGSGTQHPLWVPLTCDLLADKQLEGLLLKVNCALQLVLVLPLLPADLGATSGMKTGRSSWLVYYFHQKHSSQLKRNQSQIKEIWPEYRFVFGI